MGVRFSPGAYGDNVGPLGHRRKRLFCFNEQLPVLHGKVRCNGSEDFAPACRISSAELRNGCVGKRNKRFSRFEPWRGLVLGQGELSHEPLPINHEFLPLAAVLLVVGEPVQAELEQVVKLALNSEERLLGVVAFAGRLGRLLSCHLVESCKEPWDEGLRDGEGVEEGEHLGLQGILFGVPLGAEGVPTAFPRAAVVEVPVPVPVRVPLRGEHAAAGTAPEKPGVGEGEGLCSRVHWALQDPLRRLELLGGDHGLVGTWVDFSLEPDEPHVERVGEELVEHARGEWATAEPAHGPGAQAPHLGRGVENLHHRGARKEHVPHAPHQGEPFGVLHHVHDPSCRVALLQVAQGNHGSGHDAQGHAPAMTPFQVVREVVAILGRHPEHDGHEELVVTRAHIGALGGHNLLEDAFSRGPHEGAAIKRISRKAVELPAHDPLGLAALHALEEFGEHGPPWVLRGPGLGQDLVHEESPDAQRDSEPRRRE